MNFSNNERHRIEFVSKLSCFLEQFEIFSYQIGDNNVRIVYKNNIYSVAITSYDDLGMYLVCLEALKLCGDKNQYIRDMYVKYKKLVRKERIKKYLYE